MAASPKFGTLYSYWSTEWACNFDGYVNLVKKASSIGFDILEISADHVFHMSVGELEKLNEIRKDHGLTFTLNSGPAKEYDLASADEKGVISPSAGTDPFEAKTLLSAGFQFIEKNE